jgi:1-acyl-sn-glycerol-3-phosphate acyltransferase
VSVERQPPGPLRYHLVRLVLKAVTAAYVRTRVVGAERIPPLGPYIICFNHPSWLDPIFFAAYWPDRQRIQYVFGPREQDMSIGLRNRLISWTRRDVPFKPGGQDAIDATRRAVAVLRTGACLAIAGEGRLTDREGEVLPLQAGLAHFARLAGAPIVPAAIVGSRWISFGSRVEIRIGRPCHPADFGPGKAGLRALTDAVRVELTERLADVEEREPPGWLGRTISDAFNERPWLDGADGAAGDEAADEEATAP